MSRLNAATALFVACLTLACGKDGTSPDNGDTGQDGADDSMITLKGIVYGQANTGAGCTVACSWTNPLPGATVSTSLDGATVTTDANGTFSITTLTRSSSKCLEFTVNIVATGYTPYHVSGAWGNHSERNFALAPPLPSNGNVGGC